MNVDNLTSKQEKAERNRILTELESKIKSLKHEISEKEKLHKSECEKMKKEMVFEAEKLKFEIQRLKSDSLLQ